MLLRTLRFSTLIKLMTDHKQFTHQGIHNLQWTRAFTMCSRQQHTSVNAPINGKVSCSKTSDISPLLRQAVGTVWHALDPVSGQEAIWDPTCLVGPEVTPTGILKDRSHMEAKIFWRTSRSRKRLSDFLPGLFFCLYVHACLLQKGHCYCFAQTKHKQAGFMWAAELVAEQKQS